MPSAVVGREGSNDQQERKRRNKSPKAEETESPKRSRKETADKRDDEDERRSADRRDKEANKRRDDDNRRDKKPPTNGNSTVSSSTRSSERGATSSSSASSTLASKSERIIRIPNPSSSLSQESLAEKLKSKEMIYEAKMKIQERLKELGLPVQHVPLKGTTVSDRFRETVLKPEEASAFTQMHMEKLQQIQRLNEVRNRVAKGVSTLNLKTPSLLLDTFSSADSKPKPPGLVKPVLATKAERSVEDKKPGISSQIQQAEPDSSTSGLLQEFLDPRLHLKPAVRQRRAFEFKQPGEYEKLAKIQRSKAKLERLQSEIEKAAKQTGISSAVKLAIVTPSGLPESSTGEYIPTVEWWDEVVLGHGKGYQDLPSQELAPLERYADSVTDLVEHPIQLKPPDEPLQPQYIKASLTKKERKKLRRQNRREALKEKAEKIRLGLEKPPEPKLKISNLMRVLGTDAIQDPTKAEAQARKQMAERAQKHVEDNTSRKLTREEKAAKAIRKIAEDTTLAVHVTVFKIKSLANPAKKFKLLMNAKQLQMTGVIILLEDINVVVMEGGPKQQKFYKNLLLNRIKWSDEIAGQKHSERRRTAVAAEEGGPVAEGKTAEGERNECTLIWEGVVQKRAFMGEPRFHPATNHKQAREMLDKHGVAHYWDLCYSTTVLLNDEG